MGRGDREPILRLVFQRFAPIIISYRSCGEEGERQEKHVQSAHEIRVRCCSWYSFSTVTNLEVAQGIDSKRAIKRLR